MFGVSVAVVLLTLAIVYLYKNAYKKTENFPPGPPNLPILGGYGLLRVLDFKNLSNSCTKIGDMYKSKVLGLNLGKYPSIIVNDKHLIKEMLNRDEFDGRMDIIAARLRSYWKKLGIFFTDGYFWHLQRRFSLRYMRDYGFGRRDDKLEDVIENEIKEIIDMRINGAKYPAEEEVVNGELVYLPFYISTPFINGMCHVLARMTLPRSDYHALYKLARAALQFQRSSDDLGGALSLWPWMKDFFPNWSGFKGLYDSNQDLLDFFEKLIEDTMSTFDESYDRHFIDMYIRKMKEEQRDVGESKIKKTTYSVDQLCLTCTDYMFPPASAVQSVLTMLIERLLIQPEIQEKVHEELDRVIGRDRLPNLDDRKNLPYTECCIREMMRFETFVPLGVPHRAMSDTQFGGYTIPEGTLVAANYVILHMDKETWGDPEIFRPERFIADGQFNPALDKSLPFGAGRRLCAGETYARQSMFQVFACFMQTFKVFTADGHPLKRPSTRIPGITTTIPNFWVRIVPRS